MERRKEYAAVDLFKMFCAILVLMIHTKPFENNYWMDAGIGMVTRFAVPFFFTVSGYFLFKRTAGLNAKDYRKTIGTYVIRLLRFYAVWFVIQRVVDVIFDGAEIQSVGYYLKNFFFTGDGSALWFVEALIWAVIIVAFLNKRIRSGNVFLISLCFLLIGYSFSTLYGVTGKWSLFRTLLPVVSYTGIQGGLFFAFSYVSMGAMLAEKEPQPAYRKDIAGIILFFILLGAESLLMVRKLNASLTFLWLSALPMTWFVVRLTLTIRFESKPYHYVLRKISTLCYVLHVVVFKILRYSFKSVDLEAKDPSNLLITASTLLITLVLAYGIYLLSRKKSFTWLKYIM